MQLICLRGGSVANSQFDTSLLKPVKNKKHATGFDESLLKPVTEDEEQIQPELESESAISKLPRNVGIGLLNLAHSAENYPHDIVKGFETSAKEFGNKIQGSMPLPPELMGAFGNKEPNGLSKRLFHLPEVDYAKMLGQEGEGTLLDKIIQKGVEYAPELYMGGGLLKAAAKKIPLLKSVKGHGALQKKIAELEAKHAAKTEAHGEAKQEFNILKDIFESNPETPSAIPSTLRRKGKEAEQNLEVLRQKQEAIPEYLRATEEPGLLESPRNPEMPPNPKTTPLSLVEPERAQQMELMKFEKPEVSTQAIDEAQAAHKNAQQQTAAHEEAIGEHLGAGSAHRKRVAEKLNPILEARQNEIGAGYNKYIAGLEGKNVALKNPRDAKKIMAEMSIAFKKGGYKNPEIQVLAKEMESLGKAKSTESIPASKFVSTYRTMRQLGQKVRSSAFGKPQDEYNRLIASADSIDSDVKRMKTIIDEGLGKENLEELNALNRRYATEVAPLFKNKFYQEMLDKSKAPKGMMEHLTNEPYIKSKNPNKVTGTQILNDIIKNDPELLKHVVGEKFARKPAALHEWDEIANEFIQHMSDLQNMRNQHFQSMENEAQTHADLQRAKHEHQVEQERVNAEHKQTVSEAKTEHKKSQSEANRAAEESTRLKKEQVHTENERLRAEHAKEKERIKEEHKKQSEQAKAEHKKKEEHFKINEQIKGLEAKSAKLKAAAEKMSAKAARKNITLKEKLASEKELREHKVQMAKLDKDMDRLRKIRNTLIGAAASIVVGAPVYNKVSSLLR